MSQLAEFILVLVGSFSVILTLMSVFFFVLIHKYRQNLIKKQNEALNNLIVGQDEERQRLARDLHDEMGPQLSGVIFTVDRIRSSDPDIQEAVKETKAELKKAIQDLRKISHDLMSQSLVKFGLKAAIEELIYRQAPQSIQIQFAMNTSGLELGNMIQSHLFKITQELIHNSNKYSEADKIVLLVMNDQDKRVLKYLYEDNGKGNPDYNPQEEGIGLKNIKTRVGLMSGHIEVDMQSGFSAEILINY